MADTSAGYCADGAEVVGLSNDKIDIAGSPRKIICPEATEQGSADDQERDSLSLKCLSGNL